MPPYRTARGIYFFRDRKRFRMAAFAAVIFFLKIAVTVFLICDAAGCASAPREEMSFPPAPGDEGYDLKRDPFVAEALDIAEMHDEYGFMATHQVSGFIDETSKKVVFIDDDTVSILIEKYYYLGGAHGTRTILGASFARTSGKKVTLDDIAPGMRRTELTRRIREALKARLKTMQSSPNDLDRLPEPTENFYFARDGLHMIYNEYELGAYGLGGFDLRIDWPRPAFDKKAPKVSGR